MLSLEKVRKLTLRTRNKELRQWLLLKCKPTSPGRRFVVKVVNPDLHKGKPLRASSGEEEQERWS